jgi:molecular chaperone DnaJ
VDQRVTFLKVKQSSKFRWEGLEIYSDATVSYLDAILGASVKTPVDGEVTIKVPPGTQPGQVMRLKGNGAPRLGHHDWGSQMMSVVITTSQ